MLRGKGRGIGDGEERFVLDGEDGIAAGGNDAGLRNGLFDSFRSAVQMGGFERESVASLGVVVRMPSLPQAIQRMPAGSM